MKNTSHKPFFILMLCLAFPHLIMAQGGENAIAFFVAILLVMIGLALAAFILVILFLARKKNQKSGPAIFSALVIGCMGFAWALILHKRSEPNLFVYLSLFCFSAIFYKKMKSDPAISSGSWTALLSLALIITHLILPYYMRFFFIPEIIITFLISYFFYRQHMHADENISVTQLMRKGLRMSLTAGLILVLFVFLYRGSMTAFEDLDYRTWVDPLSYYSTQYLLPPMVIVAVGLLSSLATRNN